MASFLSLVLGSRFDMGSKKCLKKFIYSQLHFTCAITKRIVSSWTCVDNLWEYACKQAHHILHAHYNNIAVIIFIIMIIIIMIIIVQHYEYDCYYYCSLTTRTILVESGNNNHISILCFILASYSLCDVRYFVYTSPSRPVLSLLLQLQIL